MTGYDDNGVWKWISDNTTILASQFADSWAFGAGVPTTWTTDGAYRLLGWGIHGGQTPATANPFICRKDGIY